MIAIINYGLGNIGSILNMFKRIGETDVVFTNNESIIAKADKILLPGVGAFDKGMENLNQSGLISVLTQSAMIDKKPLLGICLGMQLLTQKSDEGRLPGLGFIDAETKSFSFPDNSDYKVPHMGWNDVHVMKENPLINKNEPQRFYFVHSFYVKCNNEADILASTDYGITFTSAVKHDNIIATQFHPEKSHKFGLRLLENFAAI